MNGGEQGAHSPPRSPGRNENKELGSNGLAGGLFAGLQMTSSEKTPKLSNSSTGKVVDLSEMSGLPPAPSLKSEIPLNNKNNDTESTSIQSPNLQSEIVDNSPLNHNGNESKIEDESISVVPSKEPPLDLATIDGENDETNSQPKKEISAEDERALKDAFGSPSANTADVKMTTQQTSTLVEQDISLNGTDNAERPSRRGLGWVHQHTPVPRADICLTFLRKFAFKTQHLIPLEYGGTKSKSIWQYVLPTNQMALRESDNLFGGYGELTAIIFDETHDRQGFDESTSSEEVEDDIHNRGISVSTEATEDDRNRAGLAIALFVYLFSVWGHASSAFLERKDRKSLQTFSDLQAAIFDAASNLVSYGCFDGVHIGLVNDDNGNVEYYRAAQMLAQSVFNSDLSVEKNELAAIKFLLGTGCRNATVGDDASLLRGSHLLQSIRTLYHVYLTTDSESNKVTARAALQQLVTSVFSRGVQTAVPATLETENDFPSDNHRDAFLVLRSICKLSMRSLPDSSRLNDGSLMHSHVGIHTSASSETWDGEKRTIGSDWQMVGNENDRHRSNQEVAQLLYTSAIHPALESKLLALELILYVLQNVDFSSNGFIQNCGSQFHTAIRNYLCVSLLKNCTADSTKVVSLSLRIFVPTVRHFRTVLKTEIEAFVTNVFFVILDSKNSPAEHKRLVVNTFHEICSDPSTLAEIFLNYDCDLSAVDLFHRIVNTLSKLARSGYNLHDENSKGSVVAGLSGLLLNTGGPSEAQMEKLRNEGRSLRLDAMKALRQILASLHASIVEPLHQEQSNRKELNQEDTSARELGNSFDSIDDATQSPLTDDNSKQNLVEIYGSKKKRRAEESEAILRFNQKPSAGISYLAKCGHLDDKDPGAVARYLLKNKDELEKTQIGECLGREPEYQNGFSIAVLHEYARLMDFSGLVFDDAIRFFLSGFRLPGEAQKIDRIMEKFAERFTEQNPSVFPTADVAFILSFSIIMLNTDLHNPAIKEERRMTREGFIRNNRGICDGKDLPEELLSSIFDRIRANPISLKEDDEAREKRSGDPKSFSTGLPAALNPASFFTSHYAELDRVRECNFQKERDHIVRTTESLLKRRRHVQPSNQNLSAPVSSKASKARARLVTRFVLSGDVGLRDEYVSPMFDVTWGPALAAFSTAIESANGTTMGALLAIASDDELEHAAENAAETIEVCLTGFRFAICTAGLCGNSIARDAYMLALSRFSQLGTGVLLQPRHVRCVQTMLSLAREDGELLGGSWEHVFRSLSEINRYHQLFQLMARNDRAAARAAERRRIILEAKEKRRQQRVERMAAADEGESLGNDRSVDESLVNSESDDDDSFGETGVFTDEEDYVAYDDEGMDSKAIDENNAREIYKSVSEAVIEAIYERSSSLSAVAVKEFVLQLCHVSRMEISVGNNGNNGMNLNQVLYRQKHALLDTRHTPGEQFHHTQPNIYNLQKLVEVTHYNMESRPRLLFADIWVTVADHLTNVALHSNAAVAMYAVDSFRQLSIQYLKREELEVFEFQRRFLKPLETVMARCDLSSTKELLLNCVGRIIHVFGSEDSVTEVKREKGGLRSGWVPILNILGLGGRDQDENVAQISFKILSGEINLCVSDESHPDVLLSEHFIETIQSLLMFVAGPHDDLCLLATDQVVLLAAFLVDKSFVKSQLKRKTLEVGTHLKDKDMSTAGKESLELWWPILLGLSQTVGDSRPYIRSKTLAALIGIINTHFFTTGEDAVDETDLQVLQLIFRGVLTPILEFAETSSFDGAASPSVPEDFEFLLSDQEDRKGRVSTSYDDESSTNWLETTFDSFMDSCVSICLRSIGVYKKSILVEEIFAILNSCLLSDSGILAVRGLRRLEQFVTSDLNDDNLTDDLWATVSHMLRRCLSVRGLPSKQTIQPAANGTGDAEEERKEKESLYIQEMKEFIAEEGMVTDRRYVGSNATMIVGVLLSSERFSISLRWRLFLTAGLGRGIIEWERVAALLTPPNSGVDMFLNRPPDYRETALYGRKWMNRLLLQIASMKEIVEAPSDADAKLNRFAFGQKLVADLTQGMLISFVEKERLASKYRNSQVEKIMYMRLTGLVNELLMGYGNMDPSHIQKMSWISPILLSSCIQSKNEEIRLTVQKLASRITSPRDNQGKKNDEPPQQKEKSEGESSDNSNLKEHTLDEPPNTAETQEKTTETEAELNLNQES